MSTYDEMLATRGVSLETLGLCEKGLQRNDALSAVSLLEQEGVSILGGDVYFLNGSDVRSALANWYFNRRDAASESEYLSRSLQKARAYIESFPIPKDPTDIPIFVIVPRKRV